MQEKTTSKEIQWYQIDIATVFEYLTTSENGLSTSEVSERLNRYGPNELPEKKTDSIAILIFRQINNPLIYVLIASSLLAIIMGKVTDGLVVMCVVLINALIGFLQEYRSSLEIAALKNMVPDTTSVIRDSKRQTIESKYLVPGDFILYEPGETVPADTRLVHTRNCKINESALTGESLPVNKSIAMLEGPVALAERTNMAFSGTAILTGTASGIVVATGSATELGKIDTMLSATRKIETPLTRSINAFAATLTIVILAVTIVLFFIALFRGYPVADAVLASITLAVAAIPEGIPAIITIALAIGVRRMALRKAVVRHLPAVETLGSTTVICSDKTGTITRNEMTVTDLWTMEDEAQIEGSTFSVTNCISFNTRELLEFNSLRELLTAGVLCNDAHLVKNEQHWKIEGDPTEGALLIAAQRASLNIDTVKHENHRVDVLPFESEHKFMVTLNHDGSRPFIVIKGAPEVVIDRCSITADEITLIHKKITEFATEGKRILAFAKKTVPESYATIHPKDIESSFEFIGLQMMIDPPREEVKKAIVHCHEAGIKVKMITGDHAVTASAIGKQLNILKGQGTLTGNQIDQQSPDTLKESVKNVNIYARVAPEHKLSLVNAMQSNGEVVAMTGDGVNDAPALKRANIGVAMGITGTDASKEAADIILTDDNFSTIVAAVEEGRRVYDNLLKSLAFVLPTNLGEALILLVSVAFFPLLNGVPLLPMLPVQILWINLVATISLALPLAFEAKEPGIMLRAPRDPNESLLNGFVILRTILVSIIITIVGIALFIHTYVRNIESGFAQQIAIAASQTMTVTSVVFLQIFYLFHCRSLTRGLFALGIFSNKSVIWGVLGLIALQIAFVNVPFMNTLFHSSPLDARSWLESILVGAIILPIISVEKFFRSRS